MKKLSSYEQECLKYVEAIDCLHKMGYELLRLCPSISPSGCSWRCAITPKSNTCHVLGAEIFDFEKSIILGNLDCEKLMPQEIARKIVKEHPAITKDGFGEDKEYMDWYKDVLTAAKQGHFPYVEADYFYALNDGYIATSNDGPRLPLPPAGYIVDREFLYWDTQKKKIKTIIRYKDKAGKPCDKKFAVKSDITHFDKK